jgi:hypothetical protein
MPNKIKSAKQLRFMQAAAHGGLKNSVGPSPKVAAKMLSEEPKKKMSKFAKMKRVS